MPGLRPLVRASVAKSTGVKLASWAAVICGSERKVAAQLLFGSFVLARLLFSWPLRLRESGQRWLGVLLAGASKGNG